MSVQGEKQTATDKKRRALITAVGDVLDIFAAGRLLGAHIETVRRLARRGKIPAYKIGKDWRFHKDALLHWIETHHLRSRTPVILVVDDEEKVRAVVRMILEKHHYCVLMAADGKTALSMIEKETPDAVLLDLKLPDMDGPAVLGEIRKRHNSLPVIIITGYPDSDLMHKALQYAPLVVLAKPFDIKQLLDAVRLAIRGKGNGRRQMTDDRGQSE